MRCGIHISFSFAACLVYFECGKCSFRRNRLRIIYPCDYLARRPVRLRRYQENLFSSQSTLSFDDSRVTLLRILLLHLRYRVLFHSIYSSNVLSSSHKQQARSWFRKIITSQVMIVRLAKGGRLDKQISFKLNNLNWTL